MSKQTVGGLSETITITISDVGQQTLLRWLANNVHHDTDEGTAEALLAQALDALKRRLEQPV